jgi:hypothetical protein
MANPDFLRGCGAHMRKNDTLLMSSVSRVSRSCGGGGHYR